LPEFSGRTWPVDTAVAQRCARLHVPDKHSERDALSATTALVHGMTVVTRNVANFKCTGVRIVNRVIQRALTQSRQGIGNRRYARTLCNA